MSKFLVNLFMLNTKAVVNAYTWTTLPFYTIAQQPWKKLRLSKSFGVRAIKDGHGRTVYSRPCPIEVHHPLMTYQTLNEVIPHLDPKRRAVGYREVLSEEPQLDERGQPIKIDGKELKKIKLADNYHWWTVEQVLERVDALARGLQAMGVTEGSKVLIYADNSFDWFCAGLAVGRLNAITVTLLSILNDEGVVYGCNQSEAPFLITSQELLTRLSRIAPQLSHITKVVYFVDKLNPADPKATKALQSLKESAKYEVATLDQVHERGAKLPPVKFKFPRADDVTLIMYTSGTTGSPKGVILTHRQLTESLLNIMHMQEEMKISLVGTSYAAYLPMGHLYGYLLNLGCFFSDAALALCSPMTMTDFSPAHVPGQKGDFQLIKPQFLGGVPLVLDRILKEVIRKLESRTPVSVPIFNYLMDYKIRWLARGYDTPIVNFLVCKKINSQFGGKFSIMLCGSAPLNERTQALMGAALNIKLLQAYGLTEVAVGATGMMTHDLTYGHCGVPLNTVSYFLKDWPEGGYLASENKGEIVIGGPTVANGYYKMPEETAECFKTDPDGTRWFETGDIGEVLPNGCLKIIDRKKDLVKLSNGEFVSLGKIEAGLRSNNLIENACACTDPYSNHVTAIISPNRKAMAELAERLHKPKSLSFEQLCDDADVQRYFFRAIRESTKAMGFAKKEIPVRIRLVKEEWTQDNNLLTAAMKMKRKQVNEFYRAEIMRMFEEANGQSSSSSSTLESGRSL